MEHLMPAIQVSSEKSLKGLSPQEFQQMLSTWFQEKGIVQDMKSYLKFQMVNVLKNTVIGKNIKKGSVQTFTLAQQASHLIVAEYLMYYGCHFALSLFSTEVNLSTILPELKLFFESENVTKDAFKQFDKENLIHILEIIGISKGSQYFSNIVNEYFESKTGIPLLLCLLHLMGQDGFKATTNEEQLNTDIEYEDDFMKNVCLVVQCLNLPPKVHSQLLHNLKVIYELKTKLYESQVVELVNKFKKELNSREVKLHQSQKRKKCLEKRLEKLQNENESLKQKIDKEKPVQSEKIVEKVISLPCSLCHCDEECTSNRRLCESYKKEIEKLNDINSKQKEEIKRLSSTCDQLVEEFNSCQSKISLVNTRLHDDVVQGFEKVDENISLSSDSITEEILQQARHKLKMLEEESEELDIRFSNFVIK